jgi:elongation factor P--beta-lysine ligase
LMLEWYRKNSTYLDIMDDVKKLICHCEESQRPACRQGRDCHAPSGLAMTNNKSISNGKPWKTISLPSLFSYHLNCDLNEIIKNEQLLFQIAKKKGYNIKNASWDELYDQLFVNEIEIHLPKEPFFLIDFPARVSPLCKPKKDNPLLTERFELYINRMEIANGNTENTDFQSIKKNFVAEQKKRPDSQSIDQKFLNSIKKIDNVSYAGIGLGIDRLTMLFSDSKTIEELGTLI